MVKTVMIHGWILSFRGVRFVEIVELVVDSAAGVWPGGAVVVWFVVFICLRLFLRSVLVVCGLVRCQKTRISWIFLPKA